MGIEAILSELRNRKNTLYLAFRNIGGFYVDGYMHVFPAIAGERGNKPSVRNLEARLGRIPELKDFKINDNTSLGFDKKVAAFEIVQLEAPIWLGSDKGYSIHLSKQGKLEKGEKRRTPLPIVRMKTFDDIPEGRFFTGHYKRQAEFAVGPVAAIYEIDASLADGLKHLGELNKHYQKLAEKIRTKHVLGEALLGYDGLEMKCIRESVSKKCFEENSSEIKDFGDKLIELKSELSNIGKGWIEYNKSYTCFEVHFDFDIAETKIPENERRWIRFKRMRTIDEILSDMATDADIEKFEYDSPQERIDLVMLFNYKNGRMTNKTLLTRYPTKKRRINGFKVVYCGDANDLVQKAASFINGKGEASEESFIFTAYYVPFDSIHLREEGDFSVGAQGTSPKKEVSTKFFEKIGIYGKHVLDPLDVAKSLFAHLPNQKLEMIANELGIDFEKGINYRQGRELSIAARTGETAHLKEDTAKLFEKTGEVIKEACALILMDYATKDGIAMGASQKKKRFKNAIKDRVHMSVMFKTDPFKLIHDPNRVNDSQERSYFENVGVNRDDIYKRWQVMLDYEKKAMARFNRFRFATLEKPKKRGLFRKVYKAYVPVTRFLIDQVSQNFPPAKELIAYGNRFSKDKVRQADIAHYEDRLCNLMIHDYAICLRERDELLNRISQVKKEAMISEKPDLFNPESFDELLFKWFYDIRQILSQNEEDKKMYRDYNVTQKMMANLPLISRLNIRQMQSLFNQWAKLQDKERKVYGNYRVRAFMPPQFIREKEDIMSIEEALDQREKVVMDFISMNGLELLHTQENYVYLQGDRKAFFKKDCPFFLVDEMDRALITFNPSDKRSRDKEDNVLEQKVYYAKHGFFEGIEIDEEAKNKLSVFEMETYGGFIEKILQGKYEEALQDIYDAFDCLSIGKVPNENIVWFNKSKKRYKAYEDGERRYFYTDRKHFEGKEVKVDDFSKREYVEESIGKKDNLQRVYLMQVKDLRPDWNVYQKIIYKKARDLLEPFLGEDYMKMITDSLGSKEFKEIARKIKLT